MIEFWNTKMGRTFFEGTMPRIATGLERLCAVLEEELKSRTVIALKSDVEKLYRPSFDPDPARWDAGHSDGVLHYADGFQFGSMLMHVTAVRVSDYDGVQQDEHDGSYLDHLSGLDPDGRFTTIEIPGHKGEWVIYFSPYQE